MDMELALQEVTYHRNESHHPLIHSQVPPSRTSASIMARWFMKEVKVDAWVAAYMRVMAEFRV